MSGFLPADRPVGEMKKNHLHFFSSAGLGRRTAYRRLAVCDNIMVHTHTAGKCKLICKETLSINKHAGY
jgi:hypothetical protein